ncbi:MAG: hypothetical protein ACRC33_32060 [Gemmataceae bacterium]
MSCLSDEQIASLATGEAADRGHAADCAPCAARLAALLARMDRLEAAVARDAGRARLLAALEREPVPTTLFWRLVMNRRNWAAAAAAIIAVTLFGWPAGPSALAEALRPFKEAKSFACDLVPLKDGKPLDESLPADKRGKLKVRLTWAAPGSLRVETAVDGKPSSAAVVPHGKDGVMLDHAAKRYTPVERKRVGAQEEAVLRLINTLAGHDPGDAEPAGTDEVGGRKAPRFDLTVTDPGKRTWHYRVWADPATKRALRVEFALLPGVALSDPRVQAARLENFEWDAKAEGAFDATPPEGYKLAAVKAGEAQEKMTALVVAGLRAYREGAGGYPKDEPFNAPKAVTGLEKASKKKVSVETLQGLVTVGVLQAASDGKYHGKTVGPDDKARVLFRWKLDDGRYRVLFGDLRAETVSAEKLKGLEGK